MGLSYRSRHRLGKRTHANVSRAGVSVTHRVTDRVTVNTRGRLTVRLAPGLSLRLRLWR